MLLQGLNKSGKPATVEDETNASVVFDRPRKTSFQGLPNASILVRDVFPGRSFKDLPDELIDGNLLPWIQLLIFKDDIGHSPVTETRTSPRMSFWALTCSSSFSASFLPTRTFVLCSPWPEKFDQDSMDFLQMVILPTYI